MSRKPYVPLPDTDDPYVLLDVRPGASADNIRRAYLRRVKMYKPDRHPAEFRRVREAYDWLREREAWFRSLAQEEGVLDPVTRAGGATADDETVGDAQPDPDPESDDGTSAESDAEAEPNTASTTSHVAPPSELPATEPGTPADDEGWEHTEAPPQIPPKPDPTVVLEALAAAVHRDLIAERWAEATARVLEPDVQEFSAEPSFAELVLEVACAVVWAQPERYDALADRFADLISAHDIDYRGGALLHRRTVAEERDAWHAAVASWPELSRFVSLGASLRAPAEAELGLLLGRRASDDPGGFLAVLNEAGNAAPNTVAMYIALAERWSQDYGQAWPAEAAFEPPRVEQAADAILTAIRGDRRVRWEQVRPLVVLLVLVGVILVPSVFGELLLIGFALVAWAYNAVASEPESRIYRDVVQPAAANWLWATEVPLGVLAAALAHRLPGKKSWAAFAHPGDLSVYPEYLAEDLTLAAFAATGPLVPRLRR